MLYTILKVAVTAALVVAISEAAKRSTALGGVIASLPLTSLLAFIWLYGETGETAKVAELSRSIFWYVLPSLVLFITLPIMLSHGVGFWLALLVSCAMTFAAYVAMTALLANFGVTL
ncbi:MAG: DUF3147 family protein [Hyphomicrobium sp.]